MILFNTYLKGFINFYNLKSPIWFINESFFPAASLFPTVILIFFHDGISSCFHHKHNSSQKSWGNTLIGCQFKGLMWWKSKDVQCLNKQKKTFLTCPVSSAFIISVLHNGYIVHMSYPLFKKILESSIHDQMSIFQHDCQKWAIILSNLMKNGMILLL